MTSVTPLDPPVVAAAKKFPGLDLAHVSDVPVGIFLYALNSCIDATKAGVGACKLIDTIFGDVMRGCIAFDIIRDGDSFEMWNGTKWILDCKPVHVCDRVRAMLKVVFSSAGTDSLGNDVLCAASTTVAGRVH